MADPEPSPAVPGPAETPVPDAEPVVEVRDVVARYDDQVILNGVSLTVRRGEVMIILGGSGSGKSTLLKCMLGIHPPESGSVRILGVDMYGAPADEIDEVYRRAGMVYQSGALFGSLTTADNIALPLREHTELDEKIIDITVRMKLGLVGLSGFGDRLPSQLSGGQAKRAAFARAIALDPEVLFCDEPSAGLDPRIGRGIDDLIRNLNRAFRMAVVVVTHEMESVKLIGDRITMLSPRPGGAQVVFQGSYDEMVASEDPLVRDFVRREPMREPRREAHEILRHLVGEE